MRCREGSLPFLCKGEREILDNTASIDIISDAITTDVQICVNVPCRHLTGILKYDILLATMIELAPISMTSCEGGEVVC